MEKEKTDNSPKRHKENPLQIAGQLLLGALVISAVGIAAYALLLLMMYFI